MVNLNEPLEISLEALDAFRRQSRARLPKPRSIRVGVRGGACSGLQYVVQFDDEKPGEADVEWFPEGWNEVTSFIVDKRSMLYLSGCRIVWISTLMKQGFDFENPHETSRCGCGHSFDVK
jgi:iron-sulfur cluster assembly protein